MAYFGSSAYTFGISPGYEMHGIVLWNGPYFELRDARRLLNKTESGVDNSVVGYGDESVLCVGGKSILNTYQRSVRIIQGGYPLSVGAYLLFSPTNAKYLYNAIGALKELDSTYITF